MNPVVESLRVIGALMVVTHHYTYQLSPELARQWSGLHFFHNGVDLFFVITGYLFAPLLLTEKLRTEPLLAEKPLQESQPLTAAKFLKRRFFRLYPLYLLSLATFVLSGTIPMPALDLLVEHLFLLQNLPWNSLRDAGAISLVYWTLAVEFQFYLFVLLLSIFYRYVKINNKFLFLTIIAAIGFFSSAYLNYAPKSETWVLWQAQLPALLPEFCFGMFVYHYSAWWRTKFRSTLVILASTLLLTFLYLYYPSLLDESLSARPFGIFNLVSALGYAGVLAGCLGLWSQAETACSRSTQIAIFCGGLSYSVYLFHEVTIHWIQKYPLFDLQIDNVSLVLLALIATLVLAVVINRWVEIPLRDYGRQ